MSFITMKAGRSAPANWADKLNELGVLVTVLHRSSGRTTYQMEEMKRDGAQLSVTQDMNRATTFAVGLLTPPQLKIAMLLKKAGIGEFLESLTFVELKSRYVDRIVGMYESGEDNAYESFKRLYGETHHQDKDESDIDYVRRCAEQDFEDGTQQAALYQEIFDELWMALPGEKRFIRCEESILGLLSSLGAEFDFKAYDHGKGGVDATVNLTALARIAEYPADFQVEDIQRKSNSMVSAEKEYGEFSKRMDAFWQSVSGFFSEYSGQLAGMGCPRSVVIGGIRSMDSRDSCESMSQADWASIYLSGNHSHAFAGDAYSDSKYGEVRVPTMYGGLVPVREFDAVEIENMTDDLNAPGELIVADDGWREPGQKRDTVTAISVRLHYRRGGVETVSDFTFDPATPDGKAAAESKARDLAVSLSDMIMMADPELKVDYVLGGNVAKELRSAHTASAMSVEM